MTVLIDSAMKSFGLMGLLAILLILGRRVSAALRHRVWALGFVGLALLPLLSIRLPEIKIERPASTARFTFSAGKEQRHFAPSRAEDVTPTVQTLPKTDSHFAWERLLIFLWGGVAFLLFIRTLTQLVEVGRLSRFGNSLAGGWSVETPAHTYVATSPNIHVPVTFGFVRPTILLPESAREWPGDRFRAVLLHEGAHIRRGDWAWLIFAELVRDVYWFNPLVHWAAIRLKLESELAADDAVLQTGLSGPEYASMLVDFADSLRGRSLGASLPFVEIATLKARVAAILNASRSRKPIGRRVTVLLLAFGLAVMGPYAAVHLVAGPDAVHDGVIVLGDGQRAEIVAITEMRGKQAVSWDIHGAMLRRPFPMTEKELSTFRVLQPNSANEAVRYVVFRIDDGNSATPMFYPDSNGQFVDIPYGGPGPQMFQDALGGTYRVLRVVKPVGSRSLDVRVKLPTSVWKLYAFAGYEKGQLRETMNPLSAIHLAPKMPNMGKGSEVTCLLPEEFADRESTIRILPTEDTEPRFEGVVGSQTAMTTLSPDRISRVEILSRPLRSVVFAGLPMEPDAKAVYQPRRFLPEDEIDGTNSEAKLPDGSKVTLVNLVEGKSQWNRDGNPVENGIPGDALLNTYAGANDNSGDRRLQIWFREGRNRVDLSQEVYDDEGWPLFRGFIQQVYPDWNYRGFYGSVGASSHQTDLSCPVAIGPYERIVRFDRKNPIGTTWEYDTSAPTNPGLLLTYPSGIADRFAGKDWQIQPLDASGHGITWPNGRGGTEASAGWVKFECSRAEATRIAAVEIRARPFVWIRFRDVALEPKAEDGLKR